MSRTSATADLRGISPPVIRIRFEKWLQSKLIEKLPPGRMASKSLPLHSFLLRPVAYGVPLSPTSDGDSGKRAWPEWNGFEPLTSGPPNAPARGRGSGGLRL